MGKKTNLTAANMADILKFLYALKKEGIDVTKAVLFGSYAKGSNTPDSDIDIAVVSPQFGRDAFGEMVFLRKIALTIDSHIEPLPFSPSGISDRYSTLAQEIRKYGKTINFRSARN